jgi:hypothetical protein
MPAGFDAAGKRLWKQITGKWSLRADELRVLEDACHEADLIDVLQAGCKGAPLYMRGAQGQQVVNPLFTEIRQHRTTLKLLMATLKLADDSGGESPRSVAARKAVAVRWNKPA